jgi:cysteine desulfurase
MAAEGERLATLRQRFLQGLEGLENIHFNGDPEHHLPGILNLAFGGVDGESLLLGLKDIAVSSGSACTSASLEASYVLRAIGLDEGLAQAALRFSFGRFTSEGEAERAAAAVRRVVTTLRGLAATG